ncbi:bifunctional DNA primase/polymerase [Actinopolyspora mortivallis]|uniref:DNA primase n=1 Tax=Actinopolyspora mortivallis TaxID=33906 RepID=A0A2T0GV84_ACTMO|nr:bifunctional DNA primase/polymerase [Actinopolyspora mortivallis]PRW63028.1 DNA primase [Actinopolyspora mortivallis]
MSTAEQLRRSARDLAEHGWPVFPLVPDGKRPALHGRSRCPGTGPCSDRHLGWEQRATTDPQVIDRCWTTGAYNIGLAAGEAGQVVIDLDVHKPGESAPDRWSILGVSTGAEVLQYLAHRQGEAIPATYTVRTPSGGWHLYYRAPAGTDYSTTTGKLGWLVDTRARGGYVVAPGSTLPTGSYELYDDRDPVPLPGWLAQRLSPSPSVPDSAPREIASTHRSGYLKAALGAEADRVRTATPGTRNHTLFLAACALGQLVAGGALTEAEVRHVLQHASQQHLTDGAYTPTQRDKTITSGLTTGAQRPRHLADHDAA